MTRSSTVLGISFVSAIVICLVYGFKDPPDDETSATRQVQIRNGIDWNAASPKQRADAVINHLGLPREEDADDLVTAVNAFYAPSAKEYPEVKHQAFDEVVEVCHKALVAAQSYKPEFVEPGSFEPNQTFSYYRSAYREKLRQAKTGMDLLKIGYEIERTIETPVQDRAFDQAYRDLGYEP